MSRKIYKETLKIEEALGKPQLIQFRKGGHIVHVDYKTWGNIDFWIEVDADIEEVESRAFQVYPTGDEIYSDATYVATSVQRDTDHLGFTKISVWHVYERKI